MVESNTKVLLSLSTIDAQLRDIAQSGFANHPDHPRAAARRLPTTSARAAKYVEHK